MIFNDVGNAFYIVDVQTGNSRVQFRVGRKGQQVIFLTAEQFTLELRTVNLDFRKGISLVAFSKDNIRILNVPVPDFSERIVAFDIFNQSDPCRTRNNRWRWYRETGESKNISEFATSSVLSAV